MHKIDVIKAPKTTTCFFLKLARSYLHMYDFSGQAVTMRNGHLIEKKFFFYQSWAA